MWDFFISNNIFYSNNHFLISSFVSSCFSFSSSIILIIFVFFHISLAFFTTDISVNTIHNSNNISTNTHHHDIWIVDVIPEAIRVASIIPKYDVAMMNRNKKLINALLSLHPKYVKKIFLNLKLTFHQIKIASDINTITQLSKDLYNRIPYHSVHFNPVTLIIGVSNTNTNNINKYHINIFSFLSYLSNLCNTFMTFLLELALLNISRYY